MIRIIFSEEAIEQLNRERWSYPKPRVQRRLHALYYKSEGYAHQEIERLVDISAKSLRSFLRMYESGGIEAVKVLNYPKPQSALLAHQPTIESEFRARPVKSIKEAAARIEVITGVKRSRFQVSRFLKQIGMSRRKVGQIPAKADVDKQEEFLKKTRTAN